MRTISLLIASAVLVIAAPAALAADYGGRAGVWFDGAGALLGVEALVPVTDRIFFNPNVEAIFGDEPDFTVNADLHYDITAAPETFFWVGAGPALLIDDGSTDFGLNLLTGYGLDRGTYVPYVQLKVFLGSESAASLAVGVRF
jgi:hypothetical protein